MKKREIVGSIILVLLGVFEVVLGVYHLGENVFAIPSIVLGVVMISISIAGAIGWIKYETNNK